MWRHCKAVAHAHGVSPEAAPHRDGRAAGPSGLDLAQSTPVPGRARRPPGERAFTAGWESTMCIQRLFLPLLLGLLGTACAAVGPSQGEAPMRSPTLDYPEPPVQTANGRVLGADGMRPEDKLRTSPRLGSGGFT